MATETLLPTSDDSSGGTITYSTGSAAWSILDDTSNTHFITFASDGYVLMNYSDMTVTPAAINSITVTMNVIAAGTAPHPDVRALLNIGGTPYYGGYNSLVVSAFDAIYTATFTTNPATGEPWTAPVLNSLKAGIDVSSWSATRDVSATYVAITVDYYGIQASLEATRYVASLDLFHNRRPQSFATFKGNLDNLDVALGERVALEHVAGPHATGNGWEDESWEREMFVVHGHSIDLNTMTVTTTLWHERPFLATLWFPAWSDKDSGSIEDGIARFAMPGATFQCERTSSATFTPPTGAPDVTVPANVPVYASGGLQVLAASGSRTDDIIQFEFDEDSILVPASNFTISCEVNLATVTGGYQTVLYLEYDANNAFSIHYNGASARWEFNLAVGGGLYSAQKAGTASAATWYQIGARFTGAEGENDDAPYTLSIYVDRVAGTDAVASGPLVIPATGPWDLKIGRSDLFGGSFLGGQIRKIHIAQYAYTDVEMTRTL